MGDVIQGFAHDADERFIFSEHFVEQAGELVQFVFRFVDGHAASQIAGVDDGLSCGNHLAHRAHGARGEERATETAQNHRRKGQNGENLAEGLEDEFAAVGAAPNLQNRAIRKRSSREREIAFGIFGNSEIGDLARQSEIERRRFEFDPVFRRGQEKHPIVAVNETNEKGARLLRIACAGDVGPETGRAGALVYGSVFFQPRFEHFAVFALDGIGQEQVSAAEKDERAGDENERVPQVQAQRKGGWPIMKL